VSHIVTVQGVKFTDLKAIQRACERLGWTFVAEQKSFAWYGHFVGDTSGPQGFLTDQEQAYLATLDHTERCDFLTSLFGRCDHAIRVPGCRYEVGVVWRDGQFHLLWDGYHPGGLDRILGGGSVEVQNPFPQAYSVAKVTLDAERQGWTWSEKRTQNGKVEIEVNTW
jgi:hypothetical protein